MMDKYKLMILRYIREANKDLEEAESDEEKIMSLYLIRELKQIIEDVEEGANPNSDLMEMENE